MSDYFRRIPNFQYISRINERKSNNDYITVKNLFRRGIIREDIFAHFMTFTKYKIEGDERPDAVAYKFYGDEDYDWVVLAANNIIHIRDEWPLTQNDFHNYLIEKYGSESLSVHHKAAPPWSLYSQKEGVPDGGYARASGPPNGREESD